VPCEECIDVETCAIRLTLRKVRDATAAILDSTTLADRPQEPPPLGGLGDLGLMVLGGIWVLDTL
jgi:hypothetical protein